MKTILCENQTETTDTPPRSNWRTCKSNKLKYKPLKHNLIERSETFRSLNLVKFCNYVLISGILLISWISVSEAAYGCISNPCIFGVCLDDLNSSYSCYCIDGYTGKQCQTNWDECWSAPCLNGGTCIDGVAEYNCSCPDGFNGVNCEENLDECLSNPCQNGGTCDDRDNGYVCYCSLGYAGTHCEMDVAVCDTGSGNKCHNGGQCVEGRGLDFTCNCAPGWQGRFCSNEIDECESSPCQNGGICVDKIASYACVCSMGFTGPNCEEEILVCNDSPCKNSALCLMEEGQPVCYCVPDFHGEKCEYQYDECQIGPRCNNGGKCVDGIDDFSCSCKNNFRGMFCECRQLANGELDCNYTMATEHFWRSTTPLTLTSPLTSSEYLSTTFIAPISVSTSTIMQTSLSSETIDIDTTIDESSSAQSLTSTSVSSTQSVPTSIDDHSSSMSSIDILDHVKTTESLTSESTTDSSSTTMLTSSQSTTIVQTSTESTTSAQDFSTTSVPDISTTHSSTIDSEIASESSTFSSEMPTSSDFYSSSSIAQSLSSAFSTKPPKEQPCSPFSTTNSFKSTTESSTTDMQTKSSDTETEAATSEIHSSVDTSSSTNQQSTTLILTTEAVESTTESGDSKTTSGLSEMTTKLTTDVTTSEVATSESTTELRISSSSESPVEVTKIIIDVEVTYGSSSVSPSPSPTTETSTTIQSVVTEATTDITTSKTTLTTSETTMQSTETSEITTASTGFHPSTTEELFTLTSIEAANLTATDCQKITCFNGGTCVITSEGPRCVCRFDRQDPNCKSPIRVKNAAFAGDSYLSHLIYSDNHPDYDVKQLDVVLPIKIELKARTRATDGLIVLAIAQGSKGGHYTALFLHKGLLQFQFSCGLQTMLLSELEAPINTGHEFTVQVELDFSRNHSHCNASLRINDTLAMSGDQPTWLGAKTSGKSRTIQSIWLHLGGSPQTPIVLMTELPGGQGFTGCIHSLQINGEIKEIFRDASDGFGITECGSLACLANPCRNGGTCEEKIHESHDLENDINIAVTNVGMEDFENRWKCKCPTGYLGPSCEVSVCSNNPCQYGGTCVEFPGSGYICLCPLGKHGHFCEHNLEIDQPSFSGSVNGLSSYISYPVPIPLESTLDLSFRISPTTVSQISLLAFIGQSGSHDDRSDHLAVSFIQGYIMLTWNLGGGPRRIFTQKPLEFQDGEDEVMSYHIQVKRQGRKASLYVDGKLNVTGNSPGEVARLDVIPMLYIGGHSLTNFSSLPHDLPLHSGFQGCIYDLQLKSGSLVVPLHETKGIIGRSVGQCGTKECHRHACHNSGACLQHGATYTCICPDGWYGVLCSQRMNPCDSENNKCASDSTCVPLINGYECDCPIGKMGKYCDITMKYLSDVSLSGKRSYLALNWPNQTLTSVFSRDRYRQQLRTTHDVDIFAYDSSSKLLAKNIMEHQRKVQLFSMEFQVRPLSESGLLMFFGNLNDHDDGFISLSLKGGVIEFRIAGQHGQISLVRSNRILAIGEWHKVKLSQNGRRLTLWVEGSSSSNLLQSNSIFYNNYNSLIYIGGLSDLSRLPYNSITGFPGPFKGCVRQFNINGHRYVLNEQTIVESRNINDCDGTACGGDSCDLGGHCWLDEQLNPHCKCPETAKGIHCEIPESCHVIKCKNNGKCMNNGECNCPNGWGGYFCEIATNKFSLPSFNGKSYMKIPNQRYTQKDKRNGLSSSQQQSNRLDNKSLFISMNFSTIDSNSILLWNDNNDNFLGLGLENGFLKLVSNLLNLKNNLIDISMGGYITDGGWHNLQLEIDGTGKISLTIDRQLMYNELSSEIGNLELLGDSFFIGGLPQSQSITNRTNNLFHKSFSGCLQDVQINNLQHPLSSQSSSSQQQQQQQGPSIIQQPKLLIHDFSHYEGENIGECELYDEFVNNNNYNYY